MFFPSPLTGENMHTRFCGDLRQFFLLMVVVRAHRGKNKGCSTQIIRQSTRSLFLSSSFSLSEMVRHFRSSAWPSSMINGRWLMVSQSLAAISPVCLPPHRQSIINSGAGTHPINNHHQQKQQQYWRQERRDGLMVVVVMVTVSPPAPPTTKNQSPCMFSSVTSQ